MTQRGEAGPPAAPAGSGLAATGWDALRRFTPARIGLARAGVSVATAPLLDFRCAHAAARDAVHHALDVPAVAAALASLGLPVLTAASQAGDRRTYLMRPDLGRLLAPAPAAALGAAAGAFDLAVVIADGLSALAVERHAAPLLQHLLPLPGWRLAPLVVTTQGRVALGDRVALCLGARCCVVLIGERPGLSAPDSLGAYLTWQPRADSSDAERNCISNIRPEGMAYAEAARRIRYLLEAARTGGFSGVALKDLSDHSRVRNGAC